MMRPSIDFKARIFALLVGLVFLAVFLLGFGITHEATAADLDPRFELAALISEQVDSEIEVINAPCGQFADRDHAGCCPVMRRNIVYER
ncbi:MAG: hypothetical protein O7F71_11950 [Gammaproteobacteria bacterium]|nr:hypothetical protein [Gammaproteobacteria bacterium]